MTIGKWRLLDIGLPAELTSKVYILVHSTVHTQLGLNSNNTVHKTTSFIISLKTYIKLNSKIGIK